MVGGDDDDLGYSVVRLVRQHWLDGNPLFVTVQPHSELLSPPKDGREARIVEVAPANVPVDQGAFEIEFGHAAVELDDRCGRVGHGQHREYREAIGKALGRRSHVVVGVGGDGDRFVGAELLRAGLGRLLSGRYWR
jgi:hypothetical protein